MAIIMQYNNAPIQTSYSIARKDRGLVSKVTPHFLGVKASLESSEFFFIPAFTLYKNPSAIFKNSQLNTFVAFTHDVLNGQ